MTREQMIDAICEAMHDADRAILDGMFRCGFAGLENLSQDELAEEYKSWVKED